MSNWNTVKVTDFGIARITDASRTKTGMVLGTPSFMSPEHLAGQHIDGRSDLYSLGVTVFQLLTGQLPLRGDSMAALMYQIANQTAPDVRTLRPELPAALADILSKTLAKAPQLRYPNGAEWAADVQAVLSRLPAVPLASTVVEDNRGASGDAFEATQTWTREPPPAAAALASTVVFVREGHDDRSPITTTQRAS